MSSYSSEYEEQWLTSSPLRPQVASVSSGSSPPQLVPESCPLTELLHSVGIRDDMTPYLKIIEQPQSQHKFRYRSEMENSHGCVYGKTYERDRTLEKTYPEVELFNYHGRARIRCDLVQVNNDFEHPHKLCVGQEENIAVEVPVRDVYRVRFQGLCIIYTSRDFVKTWLYRGHNIEGLSQNEIADVKKRCEKLAKIINLNSIRLKFSAVDVDTGAEICVPVYSDPINNSKHPSTNKLKICRMSRVCSRARGGDDLILLVEKVMKKNIKVRFFEISDDGVETWSHYVNFLESDVHHGCAITFRTPPYRIQDITKRTRVWLELVRPTDGHTSEPKEYHYTPEPYMYGSKKRKIYHNEDQDIISLNNGAKDYINAPPMVAPNWASFPTIPETFSPITIPEIASPMMPQSEAVTYMAATPAPVDPVGLPVDDDYFKMIEKIGLDEFFNLPSDLTGIEDRPRYQNLPVFDRFEADGHGQIEPQMETVPTPLDDVQNNYDKVIIRQMVKRLQSMVSVVRILKANKEDTIANTLEGLFQFRLSNGDTVLHLIVASKQPLLDYVINLIHETNMTHLLNLKNAFMQTVLHLAVMNNLPDLIETLLSKGCDPMAEDFEGNNIIHYAVIHQACLQPILMCLDKLNITKNLDAYNNERQTALHCAVIYKSKQSVQTLLDGGASYSVRDAEGRTPLHLAAYDDCLPVLAALLTRLLPEDIDDVDGNGYTVLQIMCEYDLKEGSLEIIKLLLDKGADPMKKREGHETTAWRMARDKPAVRDVIKSYLKEEPSSDEDNSDDEYESAEEGVSFDDDEDDVTDLALPLNKMSIAGLVLD